MKNIGDEVVFSTSELWFAFGGVIRKGTVTQVAGSYVKIRVPYKAFFTFGITFHKEIWEVDYCMSVAKTSEVAELERMLAVEESK